MQAGSWGNEDGFCNGSSLQNPNWFAFVANSNIIDIDIYLSACTGSGAQWAVYTQCNNLNGAVACNGGANNGVINIDINNVIPGTVYYVVLDGFSGATCHYEVTVNSGIGATLVSAPTSTTLTGLTDVCVGASVNYTFPGFQFATNYEWDLPTGATLNTAGPAVTVNYNAVAPGNYQICVKGTNECDDIGQEFCWDVTVAPDPTLSFVGETCQGDTYTFRGSNYPVGSYNFNANGPTGTSCDTMISLVVSAIPTTYGPDQQVFKCEDDPFVFIDGVPFTSGPGANQVTYVNYRGCDSLVNYYVNDVAVNGTVFAQPASLPCGGTATSDLSLFPGWTWPYFAYDIKWFDANNNQIGAGNATTISNPGYYYAVVTTIMQNIANATPNLITCTEIFPVTIAADNSTLVAPLTSGSPVLCAGEEYTFNVTNLQPGTTSYTWEYMGGTVTGNNNIQDIDLTYATPGLYDICVNAIDGCGPGPQTCFTIQVVPSPTVTLPAAYSVCASGDNLTATIGDIPNPSDPLLHYLWTATAGPDVAGVVFSPANAPVTDVTVAQPGTYTFQFFADYNGQGCGETKTIDVTFEEALILTPQNVQACNDVLQPLPSIISLDTLLTDNGVAYTGTWTMVSGPGGTPGGTLPIQDFTGLVNTGIYVYEFTPNQPGVCAVTPVQVEIDLTNCICPPLSIDPVGGSVCNDIGDVNLSTLVLGTTGSGIWTVTDSPAGSTVSVAGNVADFSLQPSGTYEFTYTLDSPLAGCPSTAVTTVTVNAAPVATLKTVEQACNSNFSPEYVNLVEFDTLILGGVTTGTWAYTGPGADPGSGSFHPKDFNGATPGTYEYTYTITGDPSCQAVSYTINIVIEDCKCPSVAISPEESFCNNTPSINLDDYKVTTKAGSWSIQSAPSGSTASIQNGTTLLATGSPFGQYVLVFTLDVASPVGCEDTAQLILSLDSTSFAGASVPFDLCADFGSGVDLDTVLSQQQLGGTWVYTGSTNIGSSFNPATGVINFNTLPEGTGYTFNYTVSSPLSLCPDATSTVTVAKNVLPVADAGTDAFIDCVTEKVSLGGPGTSTGAQYSYIWTNTGTGDVVGTGATLADVVDAGIYGIEVINTATGCSQTDDVEVTKDNAAISAIIYEVDSISCYNKADGQISILSINGGTPVFEYSLDGGNYGSTVDFTNLAPGNHTIEVRDDNGCHYEETILMENPEEVTVELGNNQVIAEGDVVTITPDISIDVNGAGIVWTSNTGETNCNNCPFLTVTPTTTTTYHVVVTDQNGCAASDSIEIRVKVVVRVYIPNVISPNNDGINDEFYIQSDDNIVLVEKMVIYNRWGDVQFSADNIPPNEPSLGWNGRFDGQANTPAVFVYFAVVKLSDGRSITYKGDLTIVR